MRDKKQFMELKKLTTFHIGGRAKYYYVVNSIAELKKRLAAIRRRKIKYYILGSGSNILVQDRILLGAVIKLGPGFGKIAHQGGKIIAGGAVTIPKLLSYCVKHNLSGAEFLWGIPGTLGGAVMGNAGTRDKSISIIIKSIAGITGLGNVEKIPAEKISFTYRGSNISDIFIITEVELALHKSSIHVIKKKIDTYRQLRSQQPRGYSAGCVFKNPSGQSAGALIEFAGLKGQTNGGAVISQKHANFIINKNGQAKAKNVWELITRIRKTVRQTSGITLALEIKTWGEFK
ncbi:MAG: UDP-N-acetylmuramate dehydrogenase [Elusimicrobia bacterium]|nr:UDP-N-acetylmuramate dehydrogenase [Elusimicrobiota bacterium]